MATHIRRIYWRYSWHGMPRTLLCRLNVLENATKNHEYLRIVTTVESQRLLSTGASEELDKNLGSIRPSNKNIEQVNRIKPKRFDLSFEEYIKLKNNVRTRQRVAGMPFAFLGLGTSSVVSAYMFPEMFDATPENVQLIM